MSASTFPAVRSWIYGDVLLKSLVCEYEIDLPATCRLLQVGLNDTYLLTTRHAQHVVRFYRAQRGAAEVSYELDLVNHLAVKGVSVAAPIPTKDGHFALPFLTPEGTRHLVVFTYAAGIPVAWTDPEQCYLAGRLLGAIHYASDDFVSSHSSRQPELGRLIDESLEAIRPYLLHRSADWEFLGAFTKQLSIRAYAAVRMGLDWGACHGDFDAANIHIGAHEALTVFDFDRSGLGWRVCDFYHVRKAAMRRGALVWEAFLSGYREKRFLAAVDIEALSLFFVIRRFCKLGMLAENGNEQGIRQFRDDRLDRWMKFFRDWESECSDCL
jgi:Ser/Thr protein kinase RdoA (MazF antagonist)